MARQSADNRPGVGGRVIELRTKNQLTQEALAEKMGISRSALNMKERGDRVFSLEELIQLSDMFGITIDELIRGVETANVDIHRETGLTNDAIGTLKKFSREDPRMMEALCEALSSFSALDALARYMDYTPKKKGYYMSEKVEHSGSFVSCTMSEELFTSVLGQNLLHTLEQVKSGEHTIEYYSALEDFEEYSAEQERKITEGIEEDEEGKT